jgi:hypothetical protein
LIPFTPPNLKSQKPTPTAQVGLKASLDAEGVVSKHRIAADGSPYGGKSFSRGALYQMLQNRVYRGEIVHKGAAHPGEHPAIVDEALWRQVQEKLEANGVERSGARNAIAGRRAEPFNFRGGLRIQTLVETIQESSRAGAWKEVV